jgi:prevent-host-death family protein
MKRTASVVQLKARVSEYLRMVKAGDEVVVTERGVPVARLTPLDAGERRATRRDRLTRAGSIRPGRGRARRALLAPPEGRAAGTAAVDALIQDRRDGR